MEAGGTLLPARFGRLYLDRIQQLNHTDTQTPEQLNSSNFIFNMHCYSVDFTSAASLYDCD